MPRHAAITPSLRQTATIAATMAELRWSRHWPQIHCAPHWVLFARHTLVEYFPPRHAVLYLPVNGQTHKITPPPLACRATIRRPATLPEYYVTNEARPRHCSRRAAAEYWRQGYAEDAGHCYAAAEIIRARHNIATTPPSPRWHTPTLADRRHCRADTATPGCSPV